MANDPYAFARRQAVIAARASGVCAKCGVRPASPGRALCERCEERQNKYAQDHRDERRERTRAKRRERIEAGLCVRCGKNPAAAGRTRCEACLAREREESEERKKTERELNAAGLCKCGKRAIPGERLCKVCKERAEERAKKRACETLGLPYPLPDGLLDLYKLPDGSIYRAPAPVTFDPAFKPPDLYAIARGDEDGKTEKRKRGRPKKTEEREADPGKQFGLCLRCKKRVAMAYRPFCEECTAEIEREERGVKWG